MNEDSPKVFCFSCNFGWGYVSGEEDAQPKTKAWARVACSGKIDTHHVLEAFRHGADGVLILGCPRGDCHFQDGNYQAAKRVSLLRKALEPFGIEGDRLRIELAADPDGAAIGRLVEKMRRDLLDLGPIK